MKSLIETIKTRLSSGWESHPLAQEIQWERHNLFMKEVGSRMVTSVIGAVLVGMMFYSSSSIEILWLWFSAITFVALNSFFIIRYHHKNPPENQGRNDLQYVRIWHWLNLYLSIIWGILWALTPFLFFPDASQVQVLSVLMLVVVLVSTPSVTMGCYPDIYITFLTPVFYSFGWHLLDVDFGDEWLPIIIAPFTWVSLVVFSIMIHRTHMEAIILRLEHHSSEKLALRRNQAKTRFIAVASHDLRQPIQAARLYAEAMQANSQLRNDDTVNRLTDSLHSASGLLDRLLDISKIDAGVVELHKTVQPIDALLQRLISTHSIQAEQKNLKLLSDITSTHANVDANIVSEILDNLLTNAIRYTHKGSIHLNAYKKDDQIIIEVLDSGVGMTRLQIDEAFEEFVQFENHVLTPTQGMGLGLPIVKRLCTLHEIELTIDSEIEKGTCVRLSLPASDVKQLKPEIEPIPSTQRNLRILLVEDEEQVADAMSAVLVSVNHDVSLATSLDEVQQTLTLDWLPHVLITDDRLADGKDALDVIALVKKSLPDISIIVITGNTSPERLQVLRNSGLTVLFKPVSSKAIYEALDLVLNGID
ncbi:hybrid sensor histidine kinase/response regulator [Bermanella marisrubri]|nr:hybrid sensor histidine kinase/response regulator [Bermanella marisrubri]QIZ85342.1 hybrid sensor histidine kinase/response regulator [Bermanella marisrubri]